MLDRFDHKNDNNNDVSGQIIQYDTRLSWTNFVIIQFGPFDFENNNTQSDYDVDQ